MCTFHFRVPQSLAVPLIINHATQDPLPLVGKMALKTIRQQSNKSNRYFLLLCLCIIKIPDIAQSSDYTVHTVVPVTFWNVPKN